MKSAKSPHSLCKAMQSNHQDSSYLVIAHRGCSRAYPENTVAAVREALSLSCPMVEVDVLISKDRKIIVFHDSDLKRVTGTAGLVRHHNYAYIRQLNASSYFSPPCEKTSIASLEEILMLFQNYPRAYLNIEIKPESWDKTENQDNVENQIVRDVQKYNMRERVIVSSHKLEFLERIGRLSPDLKKAFLVDRDLRAINIKKLQKSYAFYSLHPNYEHLYPEFVSLCHTEGLKVFPYTINKKKDMLACLAMQVDGFFTDYPIRALSCQLRSRQTALSADKRKEN